MLTKQCVYISLLVGMFLFCGFAYGFEQNDVLEVIVQGVQHHESLITNISFDFTIDYDMAAFRREQELARIADMNPDTPADELPRSRVVEHTLRSGSARYEGNKFYISLKTVATSDGKVFREKETCYDGKSVFMLNLAQGHALISDEPESVAVVDLFNNPGKYPTLFAEGPPLSSLLTDENSTYEIAGMEEIDGTPCYVIDMATPLVLYEGDSVTYRRRFWIAYKKGYCLKRAVVSSLEAPGKIITETDCELQEAAPGIWCYSKVIFKSYPSHMVEPDVTAVMSAEQIRVNHHMDDAFTVDLSKMEYVYDKVAGVPYFPQKKVTDDVMVHGILEDVVDETAIEDETDPPESAPAAHTMTDSPLDRDTGTESDGGIKALWICVPVALIVLLFSLFALRRKRDLTAEAEYAGEASDREREL